MHSLQPNRIKHKSTKISKRFTLKTLIELVVILVVSLGIAYGIQKLLPNFRFAWLIAWLIAFFLLVILILPSKKNNCKIYVLLWRMFLFWTTPKKYKKESFKKSDRLSEDLNPYSCLINKSIVQNKKARIAFYYKNTNINFFSVFEINGINIWKEGENAKLNFIDSFANALNSIKFKASFVKLQEKVDFSKNIDYINLIESKNLHNSELWKQYYEINRQDFLKLKTDLLEDKYYLIVNASSQENLLEQIEALKLKFQDCNISLNVLENFKLLKFLNNLNMFNASDEKIINYLDNIENKYGIENDLDNLFKHGEIVFSANSIKINDEVIKISCLNKLPYELNEKWIKNLFDIDGNCVWNNFALSDEYANRKLDKSLLAVIDEKNVSRSASTVYKGSLEEQANLHMLEQINRLDRKLFDANFYIITKAKDIVELNIKHRLIKSQVSKHNITLNDLVFRQIYGLSEVSNYPFQRLDNEYYQITSFNLALGWPFENDKHNDNNNLLLGRSQTNNSPASFRLFDMYHSNRNNFNIFILGTSGMGKTTLTKKLAISNFAANNKIILIDPQAEYLDLAQKLGGQIIDLGAAKDTIINPLQIRNSVLSDDDNSLITINNHLSWLESFFKTLNNVQGAKWILLQNVIKDLYDKKGFYKFNSFKNLKNNQWPIMSDLIKFMETYKCNKLNNSEIKQKMLLEMAEEFRFLFTENGRFENLFNGHTNISLENDLIVFNTQSLVLGSDTVATKLSTMCLLNFINEVVFNNANANNQLIKDYLIKNNKKLISTSEMEHLIKFCMVIVDEAHLYIDPDNPAILKYLVETTKTIRKFYGSMCLTTQNIKDFTLSSATARDATRIIQNSQYNIIFGLKDDEISKVEELFRNSNALLESEIKYITRTAQGKCLVNFSNTKRLKIEIYYNELEKELFFKYQTTKNQNNY